MIEAKGVFLKYRDGTVALKNIDLEIDSGELVYITGPSGSGKTSFLKILMGIEFPSQGTLNVLGQRMAKDEMRKIMKIRRKIGPAFQDFKLVQGRTALENVIMGMRFLGINPRQMKKNAIDALSRTGLEQKVYSRVENLSWGERQRVSIARAVARKPLLILADEPTGNLDKENAINIFELLTSFRDENTAVIITTHATHLIREQTNATFVQLNEGNIFLKQRGEMP